MLIWIFIHPLSVRSQSWSDLGNSGFPRTKPISFSIGNKVYVGTGWGSGNFLNNFIVYDINLGIWTPTTPFGGVPREGAVAFTLNGKGYVVTGSGAGNTYPVDMWEYDPVTDAWTEKASFPGGGRRGAVAFTIGGMAYVGGGLYYGGQFPAHLGDFYRYNPSTDEWSQIAGLSVGRSHMAAFSVPPYGYVGGGAAIGTFSDFWRYDPVNNAWISIAPMPGLSRSGAMGFSLNGTGYVVGGNVSETFASRELWKYRPEENEWQQGEELPVEGKMNGCAAVVGGYGFVGFGTYDSNGSFIRGDLLRYDPSFESGIDERMQGGRLLCSPNPVDDQLRITYTGLMPLSSIEIFDASGTRIWMDIWACCENQIINIANLESGIYFVRCNSSMHFLTSRFVKF